MILTYKHYSYSERSSSDLFLDEWMTVKCQGRIMALWHRHGKCLGSTTSKGPIQRWLH